MMIIAISLIVVHARRDSPRRGLAYFRITAGVCMGAAFIVNSTSDVVSGALIAAAAVLAVASFVRGTQHTEPAA